MEKNIEKIIIESDLYQSYISEFVDFKGVEKKLAKAIADWIRSCKPKETEHAKWCKPKSTGNDCTCGLEDFNIGIKQFMENMVS